jgi:hypothetical protein
LFFCERKIDQIITSGIIPERADAIQWPKMKDGVSIATKPMAKIAVGSELASTNQIKVAAKKRADSGMGIELQEVDGGWKFNCGTKAKELFCGGEGSMNYVL